MIINTRRPWQTSSFERERVRLTGQDLADLTGAPFVAFMSTSGYIHLERQSPDSEIDDDVVIGRYTPKGGEK